MSVFFGKIFSLVHDWFVVIEKKVWYQSYLLCLDKLRYLL